MTRPSIWPLFALYAVLLGMLWGLYSCGIWLATPSVESVRYQAFVKELHKNMHKGERCDVNWIGNLECR